MKSIDDIERKHRAEIDDEVKTLLQVEECLDEIDDLKVQLKKEKEKIEKLVRCVETSTNQLRGVSIAIKTHGQNINISFFVDTYEKMAQDKEKHLKK